MSGNRTIVMEIALFLSEQYVRDKIGDKRLGIGLTGNYTDSKLAIAASGTQNLGTIAQFVLIQADSPDISVIITQGMTSITVPLCQLMVLTGPITNITIQNTGTTPANVDATYS